LTAANFSGRAADPAAHGSRCAGSRSRPREGCGRCSQTHEGWRLIPNHYDDGGLSGASLDRPALQSLLTDVSAGKINVVVVCRRQRATGWPSTL